VYFLICLITPPPGRPYVRENFGNEGHEVIHGISDHESETPAEVEKSGISGSLKYAHE
jgi:hypothetical protein